VNESEYDSAIRCLLEQTMEISKTAVMKALRDLKPTEFQPIMEPGFMTKRQAE
jgi:hypothetical protein